MFPKNLIFAIIILMFISPEEIKFMRAAELSVNTKKMELTVLSNGGPGLTKLTNQRP